MWPIHMHVGVVCYLNKQRTSLTWHVQTTTGLDLVCHLAMTCTNTEKQLFTVDYTLSMPNNALDRRGHRMGA